MVEGVVGSIPGHSTNKEVERADNIKFLGINITSVLTWSTSGHWSSYLVQKALLLSGSSKGLDSPLSF